LVVIVMKHDQKITAMRSMAVIKLFLRMAHHQGDTGATHVASRHGGSFFTQIATTLGAAIGQQMAHTTLGANYFTSSGDA
jgi:hypothetical protein